LKVAIELIDGIDHTTIVPQTTVHFEVKNVMNVNFAYTSDNHFPRNLDGIPRMVRGPQQLMELIPRLVSKSVFLVLKRSNRSRIPSILRFC
jgi:hypothetical protein